MQAAIRAPHQPVIQCWVVHTILEIPSDWSKRRHAKCYQFYWSVDHPNLSVSLKWNVTPWSTLEDVFVDI
jgi:hypothetical protein